MPEIKHNFTGGKMNKDVDERLVPKGEYRDAMNIQVSTSEGSDVGTVQNILGNTQGCHWDAVPEGSFTVGSVSDEKNDTLYWLVSGRYDGVGGFDWNQFTSVSDMIVRKTPTKCQYVFVDKYAFTITNDTNNNFGNVNQLSGLPVEISSQIQPGWTVTGLTADGSTSNAVEVLSVTPSAEYTANLGVPTISVADGFAVPLDGTTGAMGVNNDILYLAGYDPSLTPAVLAGQTVDLFDSSHPDYQTNTIVSAQVINFTFVYVQPFPQGPLFQNVSYMELTLQNAITPFTGSLSITNTTSGISLSTSSNSSIIWGSLTLPTTPPITVPIPNNLINHNVGAALSVGDPISFGFTTGCIGAINSANQFTLVNCSTAAPIAIDSGNFSFTLPLNTTIQLNTTLNLNSSSPLHESLVIEKPRVLNFNHGDYITGLNIIDDMLFWTDGKTEPKKINIPRSIKGTNDFYSDAYGNLTAEHTKLIVEDNEKGPIKEEHITVVRKAPLQPPYLEIKSTAGEGLTSGEDVVASGVLFSDITIGELITLDFTEIPDDPFGFEVGDIMLLSDNIDDLPDDWKVRVSIQSISSSTGTSTFTVKIETISPLLNATGNEWYGHLEQKPSLFQRKLPRFAYRYKYEDGEYSSFSPFTEVAFMPGSFDYEGTEAYNKGVINSIKSLKIQNFVHSNMPLDVVSVDLLYKNETSPSVYLLKSISPNDVIMRGQTENYWNTVGSSTVGSASKGSYEVSSDNITLTLPSSQSLRVWDNVPKKAVAQEITGNRIVYGNYTQGYDVAQPDIKAWLDSRGIDGDSNLGRKSIKSLRDYNVGVVWGDKYGRETPVKTSGSSGSIAVPKSKSISSNYINVDLKNSPDWAEYYRVYIKETSNEYYNLPADRVYDAADGNVWVSFPSIDRNKVDEDTYIILKKGPESEDMITEEARYKIVAIENEAPEYIKTTFERLVRTNTDGSKPVDSCNMYSGSTGGGVCTPDAGANAPYPGRKGFSIAGSLWSENAHSTTAPIGMQLTSPKVLFDDVIQNDSGSTTDELYVSFAKEEPDADGNMIPRYTDRYHVVSVEDQEVTQTNGNNYYYINLDRPIVSADSFITEVVNLAADNIHIHFWKKTIINKPEFDGRFFVKIKSDTTIQNNLISTPSATDDLMVIDSFSLYKIADDDISFSYGGTSSIANFLPSNNEKYLFHIADNTENAPSGVSTATKSDWDDLLKFGGSTRRSGWFIDNATFASKQGGGQDLPSSGKLSYGNVETLIVNGNSRRTCNITTFVSQEVVGLRYPHYLLGGSEAASITLADLDNIFGINIYSQTVGTGESNGQVAMRGVHAQGSNKYIDIAYSQFGPDGPGSDGKTQNYNLDWRIGDPANSSTDQEDGVVNNLKPESLFRVNGSDVVYKILGVHKFRLFNYHGAKRSGVAKVSKNVIPLHGTLWNTTHTAQVKEMRRKQNRRVTYRIQYEASEVYSPDAYTAGDALNKVGEPIAGITANSNSKEVIQFLTEFSVDGENPISTNPAIFETEPKDDVDIDIYYEASSSLPTLPLTNKNKHLFIPMGSTIIPPPGTDFPEGVFITSWGSINPYAPVYVIHLSTPLSLDDLSILLLTPITYVEKDTGEIVSFKVNDFFDVDPATGLPISLQITPKQEVGLNWFNCWSFNNGVESNRIGDTYNKPYITNGATASSSTEELKEEETRKNGLIYSGIYNSTSSVNNLNQFIAAEKITKDINPIYGSIQKLYSGWGQGGDLVALCEDRVLKILANKDALYNADGDTNVTSTNNVLGQAIPYSGEYGISKNPESFASEAYRAYFTDKVRGTVMRLSMDGLTPISNAGMKDWFRDHLKLGDKLIGSYDDKKDEYNITIKGDTIAETVTFKEDVKGWVSFKSFTPENAISCANEYYTFKDGSIWRHHDELVDRNTFYNQNLIPSSIEVIFNEMPGSVKSFKTVNYEGSQAKVTSKDENGVTLIDGEYFNLADVDGWHVIAKNGVQGGVVTNLERGGITEFIKKEGKWFGYVIGDDVNISDLGNISDTSNYDTEDFSIQGVGRTASVVSSIVFGCMDDGGSTNLDVFGDGSNVVGIFDNPSVPGIAAFNYISAATNDDGSCIDMVMGCIDPIASNTDGNANTDDGSCIYPGCTIPLADVFSETSGGGSLNFDPNANFDDGSCVMATYGCTLPGFANTSMSSDFGSSVLQGAGTSCGYTNCMCIPFIYGCTDPNASNPPLFVNELTDINTDNGSCLYNGCTDPLAQNYTFTGSSPIVDGPNGNLTYLNGNAFDDGSCTYAGGCTDASFCNYDASVQIDDGSCYSCGDNHAVNYIDASGNAPASPDYTCMGACTYCEDVASVTITNQTTATPGMNNGTITIEWPASTSASYYEINDALGMISSIAHNASGNTTETLTITGLGTGTYNFYVLTYCYNADTGVEQIAGYNLPGGAFGSGQLGTPVSITITSTPQPGCTDNTGTNTTLGAAGMTPINGQTWGACNYDFTATVDDGSCDYTSCAGCTDPLYVEYDAVFIQPSPTVAIAAGYCTTLIAYGCTDPLAFNYDSSANTDDGSCVPVVNGCMNNTLNNDGSYAASNYTGPGSGASPEANTNDGSCNSYNCPYGLNSTISSNGSSFVFKILNWETPYVFGTNTDITKTATIGGNTITTFNSFNNVTVAGNVVGRRFLKNIAGQFTAGDTSITVDFNVTTTDGNCDVDATTKTFTIGCTDVNADVFGSFDIADNTQCEYTGCMDATACNFESYYTIANNGSCTYCGDTNAANYDGADSSCTSGCIYAGCMDATPSADGSGFAASNYDPTATIPCNTSDPAQGGTGTFDQNLDNECCIYNANASIILSDPNTMPSSMFAVNTYFEVFYGIGNTGYTEGTTPSITLGVLGGTQTTVTGQPQNNMNFSSASRLAHTIVAGGGGAVNGAQSEWHNYVDNGSLLVTVTNATFNGSCSNPSLTPPNELPQSIVSNSRIYNVGCRNDNTAANYNANLDLHLDGSCVAANPGCMDPTATNYNAAFNQDCSGANSGSDYGCCCYTCNAPTWQNPAVSNISWDAATSPTFATQFHLNWNAVNTASTYTLTHNGSGSFTSLTVTPTVTNGLATYILFNNSPARFQHGTTYTFKLTANCVSTNGDSCGSSNEETTDFEFNCGC